MTQQPSQPPARPNPFASSTPRFGASGTTPQPAPGTPPPAPGTPPPARPSPLSSRFGPLKTNWRIIPVGSPIARFDLTGLGDPFHRLLGTKLSVEMGETAAAIKAMEAGGAQVTKMTEGLDDMWKEYNFKGALLLYSWNKETRPVLMGHIPMPENSDADEQYDDDKRAAPTILRALDLWLVINVLARTRANLLLRDAPLALEGQYLGRSLYSNDPRLLALAQATGCIEESALK